MKEDITRQAVYSFLTGVKSVTFSYRDKVRDLVVEFESLDNLRDATGKMKAIRDHLQVHENTLVVDRDEYEGLVFLAVSNTAYSLLSDKSGISSFMGGEKK